MCRPLAGVCGLVPLRLVFAPVGGWFGGVWVEYLLLRGVKLRACGGVAVWVTVTRGRCRRLRRSSCVAGR